MLSEQSSLGAMTAKAKGRINVLKSVLCLSGAFALAGKCSTVSLWHTQAHSAHNKNGQYVYDPYFTVTFAPHN